MALLLNRRELRLVSFNNRPSVSMFITAHSFRFTPSILRGASFPSLGAKAGNVTCLFMSSFSNLLGVGPSPAVHAGRLELELQLELTEGAGVDIGKPPVENCKEEGEELTNS